MNNKNLLILLILILFAFNLLQSQTDSTASHLAIKDTVCFKYKFERGDTLTYSVVSIDSIVINYGTPLRKTRNELLMIVCDSVSSRGTFYLTQELIDFVSFESYGVNQNIENKITPWLNRKIQIEIDSVGKRISWTLDDSTKPAMSPGGAFQPYLFFEFRNSCKAADETWMVSTLEDLPENGIPVPLLRQSSLFRARKDIDTLNEKCSCFEFIRTGQGSIEIPSVTDPAPITSIINAFGTVAISKEKNVPVHFNFSTEQKLTIKITNKDPEPGWHFITSNFTLNQYKHLDLEAEKTLLEKAKKTVIKKKKR